MSLEFESSQDFYLSLESVDTLISFAESEDRKGNQDNRSLFLKLSVVSMVTRFQVFIEAILEEFVFKVKNSNTTYEKLPIHLRLNSIRLLSENFIICKRLTNKLAYNEQKMTTIKTHISEIDCHFSNHKVNDNLFMKVKFPLGKTGKNELIDLFSQIEGKNIFEDANFDINEIDGLLQKRHLIIHQDIYPGITEGDILKYQHYLKNIAKYIDSFMRKFIKDIGEQGAQPDRENVGGADAVSSGGAAG